MFAAAPTRKVLAVVAGAIFVVFFVMKLQGYSSSVNPMAETDFTSQGYLGWVKKSCRKGPPPLDEDTLKAELPRFLEVYNRLFTEVHKNPTHDTSMMHKFGIWCLVRHLQPERIIESGVYLGVGTWFLRQAAPNAQLILLDPNARGLLYRDRHADTVYKVGKDFVDFSSLYTLPEYIQGNHKSTLAFLDDHQSPLERIPQAMRANITQLIFDDNYFPGGDNFSTKMACSCLLERACPSVYHSNMGKLVRNLTSGDLTLARTIFNEYIETTWEFPMIWKIKPDSENILYKTKNGLELLTKNGIGEQALADNRAVLYRYTNLAYIKLR